MGLVRTKEIAIGNSNYLFKQGYKHQIAKNIAYLFGEDKESLQELATVIVDYAKNTYPSFNPTYEIKQIKKPTNEGLRFVLILEKLFPSHILALMGETSAGQALGNCHGAALLVGGVSPVLTNIPYGNFSKNPLATNLTRYESIKELKPGDIISLKNDHSFIYLTPDWCISMNGRGTSLELSSTKALLKLYHYKSDLLQFENVGKTANRKPLDFSVYRKKSIVEFDTTMLQNLARLYSIRNSRGLVSESDHFNNEEKKLFMSLKRIIEMKSGNVEYWDKVSDKVSALLSVTVMDELEEESRLKEKVKPFYGAKGTFFEQAPTASQPEGEVVKLDVESNPSPKK